MHSRAGQGAVTGAKGLGDVVSTTGKQVQALHFMVQQKEVLQCVHIIESMMSQLLTTKSL